MIPLLLALAALSLHLPMSSAGCSAGTYLTRLFGCVNCNAGTYSSLPNAVRADSCQLCEPGTFSPVVGSTTFESCIACNVGTYSSSGASRCEESCNGNPNENTHTCECSPFFYGDGCVKRLCYFSHI